MPAMGIEPPENKSYLACGLSVSQHRVGAVCERTDIISQRHIRAVNHHCDGRNYHDVLGHRLGLPISYQCLARADENSLNVFHLFPADSSDKPNPV